jgi:hypothetical protein
MSLIRLRRNDENVKDEKRRRDKNLAQNEGLLTMMMMKMERKE